MSGAISTKMTALSAAAAEFVPKVAVKKPITAEHAQSSAKTSTTIAPDLTRSTNILNTYTNVLKGMRRHAVHQPLLRPQVTTVVTEVDKLRDYVKRFATKANAAKAQLLEKAPTSKPTTWRPFRDAAASKLESTAKIVNWIATSVEAIESEVRRVMTLTTDNYEPAMHCVNAMIDCEVSALAEADQIVQDSAPMTYMVTLPNLGAVRSKIDWLNKQILRKNDEIKRLEDEVSTKHSEISSMRLNESDADVKLKQVSTENGELRQQLEHAHHQQETLEKQRDHHISVCVSVQAQLKLAKEQASTRTIGYQKLEQLKEQIEQHKYDIRAQEQSNAELSNKLSNALQSELQSKTDATRLRLEIDALKKKLAQLQQHEQPQGNKSDDDDDDLKMTDYGTTKTTTTTTDAPNLLHTQQQKQQVPPSATTTSYAAHVNTATTHANGTKHNHNTKNTYAIWNVNKAMKEVELSASTMNIGRGRSEVKVTLLTKEYVDAMFGDLLDQLYGSNPNRTVAMDVFDSQTCTMTPKGFAVLANGKAMKLNADELQDTDMEYEEREGKIMSSWYEKPGQHLLPVRVSANRRVSPKTKFARPKQTHVGVQLLDCVNDRLKIEANIGQITVYSYKDGGNCIGPQMPMDMLGSIGIAFWRGANMAIMLEGKQGGRATEFIGSNIAGIVSTGVEKLTMWCTSIDKPNAPAIYMAFGCNQKIVDQSLKDGDSQYAAKQMHNFADAGLIRKCKAKSKQKSKNVECALMSIFDDATANQ